jgi:hypothetical protein
MLLKYWPSSDVEAGNSGNLSYSGRRKVRVKILAAAVVARDEDSGSRSHLGREPVGVISRAIMVGGGQMSSSKRPWWKSSKGGIIYPPCQSTGKKLEFMYMVKIWQKHKSYSNIKQKLDANKNEVTRRDGHPSIRTGV